MKWTAGKTHRPVLNRLFREVLGAAGTTPRPEIDSFVFDGGFTIGVFFVEDKAALAEADQPKASWLEFLVEDPAAVGRQLDTLGIERIDYADKDHSYHRAPGGPVFRLAPSPR